MKIGLRIALGMPLLFVCGCVHPESAEDMPASAERTGSALRQYAQRVDEGLDDPNEGKTHATIAAGRAETMTDAERAGYRRALASGLAELNASEEAAMHAHSQEVRALAGVLARNRIELNRRMSAISGLSWSDSAARSESMASAPAEDMLGTPQDATGRLDELEYLRRMRRQRTAAIEQFDALLAQASGDAARETAVFALTMLRAEAAMIDALLRSYREP